MRKKDESEITYIHFIRRTINSFYSQNIYAKISFFKY